MPLRGTYEPSPADEVREQVARFEASGGADGGAPPGMAIVVLTSVGAKSGKLRKTPLMRVEHNAEYAVVASLGGAPNDPAWYFNLKHNPHVELQDGAVKRDYIAREAAGPEKTLWWERAVAAFPPYADFQQQTTREIPLFVLTPIPDANRDAATGALLMDSDRLVRRQLVELLRGGNAHMSFADAVADFPADRINVRPPNVDYTFWHLIEHLRLAQADILAYLTRADYDAPEWPAAYWPAPEARATKQEWDESVAAFMRDLEAIVAIVADEATDLHAPVPSCAEHTVLREALIVADHNAYHVGELGVLRQIAGAWGRDHEA